MSAESKVSGLAETRRRRCFLPPLSLGKDDTESGAVVQVQSPLKRKACQSLHLRFAPLCLIFGLQNGEIRTSGRVEFLGERAECVSIDGILTKSWLLEIVEVEKKSDDVDSSRRDDPLWSG